MAKGNRQGSSRGSNGDKVERVSGRVLITFTNTSGTSSGTYLAPTFPDFLGTQTVAGGVKLASMAALFQYFRFTRLRWRLIPSNTASYQISGYEPDATSSAPNYSGVVGLPITSDAIYISTSSDIVPSTPSKCVVPRRALVDQNLKWWRTVPITSEDVNFTNQGSLWVGCSVTFSTQILLMDLEYTCEFKDFIAPADLPLRPRLQPVATEPQEAKVSDWDDDACLESPTPAHSHANVILAHRAANSVRGLPVGRAGTKLV
jgi:hypothetical protein